MFNSLRYHLQTTWHHLRRSPYQSLASIIVLTLSMVIMTIFSLVAGGAEISLKSLESQPQVIAFFNQPPSEQELQQLKELIKGVDSIKDIKYVDQEQALKKYQADNQDNPLLLEMVTADILPASIEVSTENPEKLSDVAKILNNQENVDEVIYQKDVINQLIQWTKFIRSFGIGLIITLSITSFFTVFIIIGMKISNRRKEVEILKLLGANSGYIQIPFILEAWIYGIVGSILGWGITYIILLYTTPYMLDLFWNLKLIPVPVHMMLKLVGIEVLVVGFWCILASTWAVNRYLKRFR